MKLNMKLLGITGLILLTGCAAKLTRNAQNVMLHTQMSTALADCKKLGSVTAQAKNSLLDDSQIKQQAINNLRSDAYAEYQADTVVLVNVDRIGNAFMLDKYVAQGIAYKCE